MMASSSSSSLQKQPSSSKSILNFVIPIAILFCFIFNNFALRNSNLFLSSSVVVDDIIINSAAAAAAAAAIGTKTNTTEAAAIISKRETIIIQPAIATTTTTRTYEKASLSDVSKYDFNLQCNISGTYALQQQHNNDQHYQYHYYASSSDYRNAIQNNNNNSTDTETIATPGILYAVGGTEEFLLTAFVPVIDYLRNGLDIPNSIERQHQQQQQQQQIQIQTQQLKQQQQRWAIATEPYLCNSIIFQQSIKSFFDIIIIITKDQLQKEYTNTNTNKNETTDEILWDPYTTDLENTTDNTTDDDPAAIATPTNTNTNTTSKFHPSRNKRRKLLSYDVVGTGSKMERRNIKLRHHVKAIKVIGLNEAPFIPYTMFIDVDMIPCISNFASTLLKKTLSSLQLNNRKRQRQRRQQHDQDYYFDIALTSERKQKKNKQNKEKGKQEDYRHDIDHYYLNNNNNNNNNSKIDNKQQNNGSGYGYNLHNSACLILNMTSYKTIELLQRYKTLFFNIPSSEPVLPNTRDQPSLGKAMYDMMTIWYNHNNSIKSKSKMNNNEIQIMQMLKHIDMNYVCRDKLTGKKNNNCDRSRSNEEKEKEDEEGEKYCLLAHKIKKLPTT